MGSSRKNKEKGSIFDVQFEENASRSRNDFIGKLFYGKHTLNLQQKFRVRHPWVLTVIIIAVIGLTIASFRNFSTKAEVADFYPTACLGNWQNSQNANGKPGNLALAAASPSSTFDDSNSAIFNDPSQQIFCGGFVPPTFQPAGNITRVGITFVWNVVGGKSADVASSTPVDESATPQSIPSEAATTTISGSTTTSFFSKLIGVAFADDSSGGSSSDSTASPTDVADSSTPVIIGPPVAVPLTPIAPVISGATSTAGDTSNTTDMGTPSGSIESASGTLGGPPTIIVPVAPPAPAVPDDNFLSVSYSTDGTNWIELSKINLTNWQNFTVSLPISNWDDLKKLQIKVSGIPTSLLQLPTVYFDGMFMETEYEIPSAIGTAGAGASSSSTPGDSQNQTASLIPGVAAAVSSTQPIIVLPAENAPAPVNGDNNFKANEAPAFDLDLNGLPAPAESASPPSPIISLPPTTTATGAVLGASTTASTTAPAPAPADVNSPDDTTSVAPPPPPAITPPPPPDNPTTTTSSSTTSFLSDPLRAMASAADFFLKSLAVAVHLPWRGSSAYAQTVGPPDAPDLPTADNPVVAEIIDPLHHPTNLQPTFVHVGTTLRILLPQPGTEFRPGSYAMRLWVWQNGAIYYSENDFSWGVLVVNFDKSIYTLGDTATIGFSVLTSGGHTVCDAAISADITSPSGRSYHFNTDDKTITSNASCGPQTVTNSPDYSAAFTPKEAGTYEIAIKTGASSGGQQISDSFAVQTAPTFDVSREAPTRIYPPATYQVTIHVKANQDYSGPIVETLPSVFQATPQTIATKSFSGDTQSISWSVNMKTGDSKDFSYTFLAPDISPELYKLGPLTIGTWQESRQWQIAADAISVQIRQELNLTDTVVTSTANDAAVLDTTQYNGLSSSTSYYFEIVGKVTSGSATTTLRRFGTTTDDAIITVTSTVATTTRVTFTPPSNASTTYFVNIVGGTSPQISAARIVVIQGGNTITNTETQVEIGNNELGKTNLTTSTGVLNDPKYWYYDSSKWDGNDTFYAEAAYSEGTGPTVASSVTFTIAGNGTWTAPTNLSPATASVELWGGGGAGGGEASGNTGGGSGGAGGSYTILNSTSVTPGTGYSYHVAATTAGGSGVNGTQGPSSTFNGATAVAVGGNGGIANAGAAATGTTTGNVGTTFFAGGHSATGTAALSGGGGGGAGSGGVGGNATGTVAGTGTATGGGGGGTGLTANGTGNTGTQAGGGGSGGFRSNAGARIGGTGAAGQVKFSYNLTTGQVVTTTLILQEDNGSFASWADKVVIVNGGTSTISAVVRSAAFTPTTGHHYRIVGKTSTTTVSFAYNIYGARIIVDQNGSPLTKMEPQYLLLNTLASSTVANQQAFTTFSPNEWSGVTNTYVHDIDASSTATSSINLLNVTASTTVNTATGTKNETTSTIVSMPGSTSTLDISISQNATTTYADRILVDTAITVPVPVVSAVVANGGGSTITLTAGTTTPVTISFTVTETGGNCSNIFTSGNITTTLYRAGLGTSCTASNQNCYMLGPAATVNDCSGGTVAHGTTTIPVYFYAQSTGAPSSSFPSDNWLARVNVSDGAYDTSSSATSSNMDVGILTALNVPISSINYGTLFASSTTGSSTQLINIENAGNTSTTIKVSGTAFNAGSNNLATSSQHYATSSFTFGGFETLLSDTATTINGINIAPVINFPIGGAGWQNVTALPYGLRIHTSIAYNGYLYTIAGDTAAGDTSTVLFAPINATGSIGNWTSTKALPYTIDSHTSIAYNGYLYTIGGSAPSGITSTVLFAPINATGSIGNWTSTKALPYGLENHTSVAYNGYLYTIGGLLSDGSTITSTVVFAPINATGSIGAWTSTQALPYVVYTHTSVAYNGYLYTIGGLTAGSVFTSTVFFAPINATGSIGNWTSTKALPYGLRQHSSVVYDGYLYAIAGNVASIGATSTVVFAPINATGSIGAWTSTQALPSPDGGLDTHTSVAYNGYLYTIGGLTGGGNTTSTVLFAPLNARSTYWGVAAPAGSQGGNYTAVNTFTAVYSN